MPDHMSKPISIAALILALSLPQAARALDAEEPARPSEERSWIQTILPTLSLLGSD